MDIASPPKAAKEDKEDDYKIKWSDACFEEIIRKAVKKPVGTVMASDLKNIESIMIDDTYADGDSNYRIFCNNELIELDKKMTLTNIENIKDFKNLKNIRIWVETLKDVSALSTQTKTKTLMLLVSSELDTIDWIASMTELEQLIMWGTEYPQITDISALKELKKLNSISIIVPSVKDISFLAELPNLESLMIFCSEDADTSTLIKAPQIKSLFINGGTIKEEN